jgi:hypothetical protein
MEKNVKRYEQEVKVATDELAERIQMGHRDRFFSPSVESQFYYSEAPDGTLEWPSRYGKFSFGYDEAGKPLEFSFALSRGPGFWDSFWSVGYFYGSRIEDGGSRFRTKEKAIRDVLTSVVKQTRTARPGNPIPPSSTWPGPRFANKADGPPAAFTPAGWRTTRQRQAAAAKQIDAILPSLKDWDTFAGGTGAARGKHSYGITMPDATYSISPVTWPRTGRHRGYVLTTLPSIAGGGHGWIEAGAGGAENYIAQSMFTSANEAVRAARMHYYKRQAIARGDLPAEAATRPTSADY